MLFTVRLRRIVKLNEQREQLSSIIELKSFLQILLSKILKGFADKLNVVVNIYPTYNNKFSLMYNQEVIFPIT